MVAAALGLGGALLTGGALAAGARAELSGIATDGVMWPAASGMVRLGERTEVGLHATVATIAGLPAFAFGPELMVPWPADRLHAGASYSQLDGLRGLEAGLRWDHDAAEQVTFTTSAGWRWGTFVPHTAGGAFVVNAYPRPWLRFSSGPQVSLSGEGTDFHLVYGAEVLPWEALGLSVFVDLGIPTLYIAGLRWAPGARSLRERDRAGLGPERPGAI